MTELEKFKKALESLREADRILTDADYYDEKLDEVISFLEVEIEKLEVRDRVRQKPIKRHRR